MAKRNQSKKIELGRNDAPTNNPFAAALAGMTAPQADLPVEEVPVAKPHKAGAPPRIRTRVERKGRGGKTVTLVEGLEDVTADARADWGAQLKKALGVGVSEEDGVLVVQGDQRERVERWFQEKA